MTGRGIPRATAGAPTLSLNVGRPTLADRFFERGLASDAYLILSGAAFTALLAHAVIPLWPVPSTGQTLGVLIAGATLGAVRGALAMLLYLGLAAAGLPVLAGGASGLQHLTGPTAGYLYAFVAAAALTGWAAQRSWRRSVLASFTSLLAASVLIVVIGAGWMLASGTVSPSIVAAAGALGLLPGTLLKVVIATVIIAAGWRLVEREESQRATADLAARE